MALTGLLPVFVSPVTKTFGIAKKSHRGQLGAKGIKSRPVFQSEFRGCIACDSAPCAQLFCI